MVEEAVYRDNLVETLECVRHVQKRMGSGPQSLKKRSGEIKLRDSKCIGGKGRLTDKVIDKLHYYSGKAMRNNTNNSEAMENSIMATWNHIRSTDENPHHHLCPSGEHSWCGFQKDIAKGTSDVCHMQPLPEAICDEILPVFKALSS